MQSTHYVINTHPIPMAYFIASSKEAIPVHHVEIYTKYADSVRTSYREYVEALKDLVAHLDAVEDPLYMTEMPPAQLGIALKFRRHRLNLMQELRAADAKLKEQNTQAVLDAFPADSKEAVFRARIETAHNALKGPMSFKRRAVLNKRYESLRRGAEGGWSTLFDGRRVMLWAFHAYEPPADGSYRIVQPLKHLGLYDSETRAIDATVPSPPLPTTQELWPWGR